MVVAEAYVHLAFEWMAPTKFLRHFFHRAPSHTGPAAYVFDQPLEQHKDLRAPGNVRMDSERKDSPIVLPVDPIKLVTARAT